MEAMLALYNTCKISQDRLAICKRVSVTLEDESSLQFTLNESSITISHLEKMESFTSDADESPSVAVARGVRKEFTISNTVNNSRYFLNNCFHSDVPFRFAYHISCLFRQPMVVLDFDTLFACYSANAKVFIQTRHEKIESRKTLQLNSITNLIAKLEEIKGFQNFTSTTFDLISLSILELEEVTFSSAFNHVTGIGQISTTSKKGEKKEQNWRVQFKKEKFEILDPDGQKTDLSSKGPLPLGPYSFPVISLMPVVYESVPEWWYGCDPRIITHFFDVFWMPPERKRMPDEDCV